MKQILKIILAICSIHTVFTVGPYQQCGGEGYSGATNCDSGYYCATVNQW